MTDHYYLTKQTVNEYIKMAKGFDERDLIEKLKGFLPGHSSVLKLGFGPGVDLEILSETYEEIEKNDSILLIFIGKKN